MPIDRFLPWLVALVAFAALLFAPQIFNDGDTYWHVAAGLRMLSDGALIARDPFSYTFSGAPWTAHEWLSEIVMALAWRAGGWGGVQVLFAGAFSLTAFLMFINLRRWFGGLASLAVSMLALACMAPSLLARPHLLALPLVVLWTTELVLARAQHRAPRWQSAAIMTLWVNLHGGFAIGFLLLAAFAVEAVVEERDKRATILRWAGFGVASLAAALINPHGLEGLLFPFRLLSLTQLSHIGEWGPADFSTLAPFEAVLIGGAYVLLSRGARIPVPRLLMTLLFLHLALAHERHVILFAAVVPLLLAGPVSKALADLPMSSVPIELRPGALFSLAMAGLAAFRLSLPLPYGGALVTPDHALARVPQALRGQPVLNDYGFGGYLIFEGVRPFIDSRAELYGDRFLANYARIMAPDPKALAQALARYRVAWTILPPSSPAVAMLDLMPGWHRLSTDAIAVVHVRNR